MARKKSELAEMNQRIADLQGRLKQISQDSRKANDPVVKPLRLELNLLLAKRALARADKKFSKHRLHKAQLHLGLSAEDAKVPAQDMTPLFDDRAAAAAIKADPSPA